jgi:hypothetical protein
VGLCDLGVIPAMVAFIEKPPGDDPQGYRTLLYLGFDGYCEGIQTQLVHAMAKA